MDALLTCVADAGPGWEARLDAVLTPQDVHTAAVLAARTASLPALQRLRDVHGAALTGAHPWSPTLSAEELKTLASIPAKGEKEEPTPWTTVLHAAVFAEDPSALQWILARGVPVDDTDDAGNTALLVACANGRLDAVSFLVETGRADINRTNTAGDSGLYMSIFHGQKAAFEYLMSSGAGPSRKEAERCLFVIAEGGWVDLAKQCVEEWLAEADCVDSKGRTPFWVASQAGHLELCKYLLSMGANVDHRVNGVTALEGACTSGNLQMFQALCSGEGISSDWTEGKPVILIEVIAEACLRRATQSGHLPIVRHCVETQVLDINAKDEFGRSAFLLAAEFGWVDIAQFLLWNGADLRTVAHEGITPLLAACKSGKCEVARWLISHCGVDPNEASEKGVRPVEVACEAGHLNVLTYLTLDAGATITPEAFTAAATFGRIGAVTWCLDILAIPVNTVNKEGRTALACAVLGAKLPTARLLVAKGADFTLPLQELVPLACRGGDVGCVKWLVEGCGLALHPTALHNAASVDVARYLIEKCGVDVNAEDEDGHTAFMRAAEAGLLDVGRYLVSAGADASHVTENGLTPLCLACMEGCLPFAEWLVDECGADVNACTLGRTILYQLSQGDDVTMQQWLISRGADIRITTSESVTCLMAAAFGGQYAMVEHCVCIGMPVDAVDTEGCSALWLAAQEGETDIVKYLISVGADSNLKNVAGHSPVCIAALHGRAETVQTLVQDYGADPNSIDGQGRTLLSTVCLDENADLVKLLVAAGADPLQPSADGMLPVGASCLRGDLPCVRFLLESSPIADGLNDFTQNGCNILLLGLLSGNADVVSYLLDAGADVNARNEFDHNVFGLVLSDLARFFDDTMVDSVEGFCQRAVDCGVCATLATPGQTAVELFVELELAGDIPPALGIECLRWARRRLWLDCTVRSAPGAAAVSCDTTATLLCDRRLCHHVGKRNIARLCGMTMSFLSDCCEDALCAGGEPYLYDEADEGEEEVLLSSDTEDASVHSDAPGVEPE